MDIRRARKKKDDVVEGTVPPKEEAQTKAKVAPNVPAPTESGDMLAPPPSTPEEIVINQYREYLKDHDISEEDLKDILDAIIANGNVEWSFDLFERIPVKFCIRPTWVNDLIIERIDAITRKYDTVSNMRYNNLIAMYNLAASMTSYNDKPIRILKDEDLDAAVENVKKMSYVVQNALVAKLAVFDRAVAVATSDWAIKNFMKPRKEKSE